MLFPVITLLFCSLQLHYRRYFRSLKNHTNTNRKMNAYPCLSMMEQLKTTGENCNIVRVNVLTPSPERMLPNKPEVTVISDDSGMVPLVILFNFLQPLHIIKLWHFVTEVNHTSSKLTFSWEESIIIIELLFAWILLLSLLR